MDKKTIDTYNELAKEYDIETADFWKYFPESIINMFADSVDGRKAVLDIGSGPGRDGVLLSKKGLEITCMDASSAMVKMCKEKGLEAVEGNFLNLPFEDDSFDGVWAYTSLLHIQKKDIDEALSEIKRVLRRGGVFGLGLIEGEGEFYRESAGIGKFRWFAFYSKKEVESLLKKSGFEILYFEKFKPGSRNYINFVAILK